MINKNKLKEIQKEVSDLNRGDNPRRDIASEIGKSVLELIEENTTEKTKEERKEFEKSITSIRSELSKSLLVISESIQEIRNDIENDTESQDLFDSFSEEVSLLREDIDSISTIIDESFDRSETEQKNLSAAYLEMGNRIDEIGKSVSEKLMGDIVKLRDSHSVLDSSFKLLQEGNKLHLSKFDIVDKNFLKFEKDLKKYASQIYEYGSSFSILNNGVLVGTTNGLNLKAGTNMTITVTVDKQGTVTAQFDATGGGSFNGTQEKSTTLPNGSVTTFSFAHTPKIIAWNGAVQTLTEDYTISGNTITFSMSAGVPQTGDKILNIYA